MSTYRTLAKPEEIYIIDVPDSAKALMTLSLMRAKSAASKLYRELVSITKMSVEELVARFVDVPHRNAEIAMGYIKTIVDIIRKGNARLISIPLQVVSFWQYKDSLEASLWFVLDVPEKSRESDIELVVMPALFYMPEKFAIYSLRSSISETMVPAAVFPLDLYICSARPKLCIDYIYVTLKINEAKPILDDMSSKGIYFTDLGVMDRVLRDRALFTELKRKSISTIIWPS